MSDPALQWLLEALKNNNNATSLWCIDENADNSIQSLAPNNAINIISNRWDIATKLSQQGWATEFNDFDLSTIDDASLDCFYYRVSKEKAITHHLLNQAWRCLTMGGKLFIAGQKNEGIKTYIEKIAGLLGCTTAAQKLGSAYVAILEKKSAFNIDTCLDSSDYTQLRPIFSSESLNIISKPGQFGWNKLDQGSAFLITELAGILAQHSTAPQSCLDLGCGYGYLTLMASQLPACQAISRWLMTDNNAAAVLSATRNLHMNQLEAQVIADDCAANIHQSVDLLLCNPPFHQGFSVEGELTDKFLAASRRLIAKGGLAVFVVNQFIPLEKKASALFRQVETFANNGSFKLVILKS